MSETPARLTPALAERYAIERELGSGGMATVYLARDLKHNRRVALKVLKPELAAVLGAERFLAEIETTANLQHPHILPLFDSGEADGFLFYVMPYIEGETLRDRLDREKQLPVDEAVGIAVAVANALRTAHEAGVIHRDIKPANILLSRGEPLVADFGIALAVGAAGGNRLTETGLSVGTPYYMSPEQATGDQAVGPASDIYALGSVLYEMLIGDPPHQGSSAQAVLGKILQSPPPSAREARPSVPLNVDGAILKALEKLPADRFARADDFAAALANPGFRYGEAAAAAASPGRAWTPLTTVFAATAGVLALIAGWALLRPPAPSTEVALLGLDVAEAVSTEVDLGDRGRLAISPDGRRIVFVGPGGDLGTQLWVREMDRLEARPIPGTDGAFNPAISPDGLDVAYTVGVRRGIELRRVALAGGPSLLVTDSLIDGGGVSWGRDGYIYTDAALEGDGFARVPEGGGRPEPVTMPREGENWHAAPFALPNGKGVLFYVSGPEMVAVVDLETGTHRMLVPGTWGGYAASGHLVWVTREGALMAQPFDPDSFELSGRPVALAEGLLRPQSITGGANVGLSDRGDLVYLAGTSDRQDLTLRWVDPDGAVGAFDDGWRAPFRGLALSPTGDQVAVTIFEEDPQIWVRSTTGGPPRKLTFEGTNVDAAWTADGEWVGYVSVGGAGDGDRAGIYRRRADGSGTEVRLTTERGPRYPHWSSDGRWLLYDLGGAIMGQPLDADGLPDGEPVTLVDDSPAYEGTPRVSPDGRWIAFTSMRDGAGGMQVFVRPFPETEGGNWQVSVSPAGVPVWSPDGSALFFQGSGDGSVYRTRVTAGSSFEFTAPEEVLDAYEAGVQSGGPGLIDVMPGDGRLLMLAGYDRSEPQRMVLVQDFFGLVRERGGN